MSRCSGTRTGIYRSKFEAKIASDLKDLKLKYEKSKIEYIEPQTKHQYTPDFEVKKGVFLETKGRFLSADRKKHLLLKAQHPNLIIIFIFMKPDQILGKRLGTCKEWAIKNGFPAFGPNDHVELRKFLSTL
jgi:hypothetical protein